MRVWNCIIAFGLIWLLSLTGLVAAGTPEWRPLSRYGFSPERPVVDRLDGDVRRRTTFEPLLKIDGIWETDRTAEHAGAEQPWTERFKWQRIRFTAPQLPGDRRIYLVFGTVDDSAQIYLNDELVGTRSLDKTTGWEKPFAIDVTGRVKASTENLLAVRVLFRGLGPAGFVQKPVVLAAEKAARKAIVPQVTLRDDWTLDFKIRLSDASARPTTARTTVTQPRGYRQTVESPVTVKDGYATWSVVYPLADESGYVPVPARCQWRTSHYIFDVELIQDGRRVQEGTHWIATTALMPHSSRGVPLIGLYYQHLVECAPSRPVYIDEDEVSVDFRAIPARLRGATATMDVVKPGTAEVLAGPWSLNITVERTSRKFSTAGWPRGEYWIRLRLHKNGRPVGAYMVRSFWKEILPQEKTAAVRKIKGFQPMVAARGFVRLENVRFDCQGLSKRPDQALVTRQEPWESEYLRQIHGSLRYDRRQKRYLFDYEVIDVNPTHPVARKRCRIASEDGTKWYRPNLGLVNISGSSENNLVACPQDEAVKGSPSHPAWPIGEIYKDRVRAYPELAHVYKGSLIRFYDPARDGEIDPKHCFVTTPKRDFLAYCETVDPEVRDHFSTVPSSPRHFTRQFFAVEKRDQEYLLLNREPLLRIGAGMDLHHTSESIRLHVEDTSRGTYYYVFRPGSHPYRPHHSSLDNINQIRRVLAVMWTQDFLHWQRRFILSPDEHDLDGTQFYGFNLLVEASEAAQCRPGGIFDDALAVGGAKSNHLGTIENYDAVRSRIWPECVWTNDFVHWHRVAPRRKLVENGPLGSHDFGAARGLGLFQRLDGLCWFPYYAYRIPYKFPAAFKYKEFFDFKRKTSRFEYGPEFSNWEAFYKTCQSWQISPAMAVCPIDRLYRAEPDDASKTAELTTGLVWLRGRTLCVNAAAEADGFVKIELQDQSGRSLPGFELNSCRPIGGDDPRHAVSWTAGPATLPNKPVRIRFALDRARLYGYFVE